MRRHATDALTRPATPDQRRSGATAPRLVAAACLLLLSAALASCGCAVTDAYEAAQDEAATALLAAPLRPAAGAGYHAGARVRLASVEAALNAPRRLAALPGLRERVTLGLRAPGLRELGAEATLEVTRIGLTASGACPTCLTLRVAWRARVGLAIPAAARLALGVDPSHEVRGEVALESPLTLRVGEGGQTAVGADLSRLGAAGVTLGLEALPGTLRGSLRPWLEGAARGLVRAALSDVTLLEVPPLELAGSPVSAAAGALEVDAHRATLFVGLMFNLDAAPSPRLQRAQLPADADGRLAIAGEVPAQALRALLTDGALAGRYDRRGQADEDGPVAVTLRSFALTDEGFEARLDLWHLGAPCFVATLVSRGALRRGVDGRFVAVTDGVHIERAEGWASLLEMVGWEQSVVVERVAELSLSLLNEWPIALPGDAGTLRVRALRYHVDPAWLAVDVAIE